MTDTPEPSSVVGDIAVGIIYLALGLLLASYWIGSPFDELSLLLHGKTTTGTLVEKAEVELEDESRVGYAHAGAYAFRVDAIEYRANTVRNVGTLTETATVEYLSSSPEVNRVSGDGAQSVFEWTWRRFGLGLILLGILVYPGVRVLARALKRARSSGPQRLSLPPRRNGGWFRYCWALGAGGAVVGLLLGRFVPVLEVLVPCGVLLALLPTLYIAFFTVLYSSVYVLTYPLRLWYLGLRRFTNAASDWEFRLGGIVDSIDRFGEWCFSRW